MNLFKTTIGLFSLLFIFSCKEKEGYLESYISKSYPGSKVSLISTNQVDSVYGGLDKLRRIAFELKNASEGFKRDAHQILTDDTAMLNWQTKLKFDLQKNDSIMQRYINEANYEITKFKKFQYDSLESVNKKAIKATFVVNNDTIQNVYYVNTSNETVCYSLSDVNACIAQIDSLISQWGYTYNSTNDDFLIFIAD